MAVKSYSVLINNKISEFNKVINVDPDKSISIRAFLIGSISQGVSKISDAPISSTIPLNIFLLFIAISTLGIFKLVKTSS